jgi:tungstate transport system ATP-binding protein
VTKAVAALEGAGVRGAGGRWIARGLDLEARAGEILVLLGPNGAGKTTALRLLHLLAKPDEGRVLWKGEPAPRDGDALLALRRRAAWVPQRAAQVHGTVLANVALPLRLRGRGRSEAERAAREALVRVGLAGLASRPAARLSGGEAQRLAFARATVAAPDLLLLDEFTASLDPASVADLEALAREERARGAAVAVVTHSPFQARRLADRAALLLDGAVAARGAAPAFFEAPPTPEARAFLSGEMVY